MPAQNKDKNQHKKATVNSRNGSCSLAADWLLCVEVEGLAAEVGIHSGFLASLALAWQMLANQSCVSSMLR